MKGILMTAIMEMPTSAVFTVPTSVELELTNKCQLTCVHCFNSSGPAVPHGTMALDDWRKVITECAELGVKVVQLIGGEPTTFPGWRGLVDHAVNLELGVEVFSNLYHLTSEGWATLSQTGVRLATSYYSVNAGEHDRVTAAPGSHSRTRANILKALELGIPIRAGVVRCHDGQLEQLAVQELRALGVQNITLDDARGVGRASGGKVPTRAVLCGNCARGRLAILPDGGVAPCVIGRFLETSNVKNPGGLRAVLASPQWAEMAASIPERKPHGVCGPNDGGSCAPTGCAPMEYGPTVLEGCPPSDSNDCNPANTPACAPKYDFAPDSELVALGGCPPNDSGNCAPTDAPCNPKFGL
ncbi:radical SAM protein [Kitasatospora purpeofusca]|uniref:radical SAM protein n=1 Tax=Kitasatospora purpeofusca TaxID=67352 RepID=UPI0036670FA0